MKNTIFTVDTLKIIDNSLKNNKGEFSDKNALLVDILKKALNQNIGCNFDVNTIYGKSKPIELIDGTYDEFTSAKAITVKELTNFFLNVSLCLEDRCLILAKSTDNKFLCYVMPKAKMQKTILIKDTTKVVEEFTTCTNIFDGTTYKVSTNKMKGKRLINENDVAIIKTAFNKTLESGWNKPLVRVAKKSA